MRGIFIAWAWANFLALIVGGGLSFVPQILGFPWWCSIAVFLFGVNARALTHADNYLAKKLGNRQLSIINHNRGIKVFNFMVELLGHEKTANEIVQVVEQVSIKRNDGEIVTWEQITFFVRRAWQRQRNGKHGLSRPYWTKRIRPVWEREDYQAIIDVLVGLELIKGRKSGASGKLRGPAQWILNELIDKLG